MKFFSKDLANYEKYVRIFRSHEGVCVCMKKNIIIHCYWTINTAFKDNKSTEEIIAIINDIAKENDMSFLELTEKAAAISSCKLAVSEEDIKNYRAFLREVRKPLLAARREKLKALKAEAIAEKVSTENISVKAQEESEVPDKEKSLDKNLIEKQKLGIYFKAILSVYSLEMSYELGLYLVSQRQGLDSNYIESLSHLYLEKYASAKELAKYNRAVEIYNGLKDVPTSRFIHNTLAFRILQIVNDEGDIKAAKEVAALLQEVKDLRIGYLKSILTREMEHNLAVAKNDEERKVILKKEEYLFALLDKAMIKAGLKESKNEPKKPQPSAKKRDVLLEFLKEHDMTLKEFVLSEAWPFKCKSYKQAREYLQEACGDDEALKASLNNQLALLEEYELSFIDTLLEIVLYFRKYGVMTSDGCQREFDIIDYATLTNYPLADLRSIVMKNKLIADSDLRYLSSLVNSGTPGNSLYNTVTLERFLNDIIGYNVKEKIYYLTEEEKRRIYDFLKHYNIATTNKNLTIATRRYLSGTLPLDILEYDKEVKRQLVL